MTYQEFVDLLDVERHGANDVQARCPAHEDSTASLHVTDGGERILVHCHANCPIEEVVRAMGLEMSDLGAREGRGRDFGEPEATYSYTDSEGKELFQVLRYPGKKFRQRRYDPNHKDAGKDGWLWKVDREQRTLYRLPEVLSAIMDGRTVFLTEGEKDADAIAEAGYCGTCNPGGAGKWQPEYSSVLAGAKVAIVADRDEPGRVHASKVKDALIGLVRNVWILQAKEGKDAYDHLVTYGHGIEDMAEGKERMKRGTVSSRELVEEAREYLELGESDFPYYEPWPVPAGVQAIALRPGRPYFIGGYTGDGKTALMLQAVRAIAMSHPEANIGIYSNEMTRRDLINRLLAHKGIPPSRLEKPWKLKGDLEWEHQYVEALAEIENWNLHVTFDPTMRPDVVANGTANYEHDIVFFDHLHRIGHGGRHDFEQAVRDFTNLALDYTIPVVIMAQLRRFIRGQGLEMYPKPTLQDFRESEMIGAEAAMALAIWRTRHADGLTYDPSGNSELIVLKDRHGPPRSLWYYFKGEQQLFTTEPPPVPTILEEQEDAHGLPKPGWLDDQGDAT